MQPLLNDRLLARHAVQEATGLPVSSLYQLMNHVDPELRFPRPVKMGVQRVRWSERAIQEWIERQKARSAASGAA